MALGSSIDPSVKKLLEKQQYEFVGSHSALKVCGWTKKALRDEGVCYKERFYGIHCHRCVQMSVAVNFCDMDCVYCWRERNNSPFKEIDDPKEIIKNCMAGQKKQLSGFGGFDNTNKKKLEEAGKPLHFAISLTGEMLYYPRLNEFIKELHSQGFTTFLVTNGQRPKVLETLEPVTQLYISIDSPDEETHTKLCRPAQKDSWDNLMQSLDIMKKRHEDMRMTLRLTVINKLNDFKPEEYAKLLEKANPHFVEVKGYMFVGASQERLAIENMPRHHEVVEFAKKVCDHCDNKIIDEQEASRVVLLMKEDFDGRLMKFE